MMIIKLFFFYEVDFQVSVRCRKGRSRIGTNATTTVRAIKTRNISVSASMTKYKLLSFYIRTTPFTGASIIDSLGIVREKVNEYSPGEIIVVLDNAAIHKTIAVREYTDRYNIRLAFLPAYSPFLNPIENLFSKWKNLALRSNVQTENELLNIIRTTSNSITEVDCSGFIRGMINNLTRCLNEEEFNE